MDPTPSIQWAQATAIVVTVNLCTVSFLAVLLYAMGRASKLRYPRDSRLMYSVALGWSLNALYLLPELLKQSSIPQLGEWSSEHKYGLFVCVHVLAAMSSTCFLIGSIRYRSTKHRWLRPILGLFIVPVVAVLAKFAPVTCVVLNSLLGVVALFVLSAAMQRVASQAPAVRRLGRILITGSLQAYALLQLLYPFAQPTEGAPGAIAQPWSEAILITGFGMGCILKLTHMVGLGMLAESRSVHMQALLLRETVTRKQRDWIKEMAHEIMTPIAELQLLADEFQDVARAKGNVKEAAMTLAGVGTRIGAIVLGANELLELDSRSPGDQPRIANLNALAQAAIISIRTTRPSRIKVFTEYARETSVHVRPVKMYQAIVNVLRNAYDAIGDGLGHIRVSTRREIDPSSPGGKSVVLSIWNDGPPIASDDWERVFVRGVSTKAHGRGLGLAISKDALEEAGGSIGIAPTRAHGERGVTFVLRLPYAAKSTGKNKQEHE